MGKSVSAINHLLKAALTCKKERPRFAYIGPTYRQAKSVIWDYAKKYCGVVPGVVFNQSELRIDFPNGAQIRVYGGDNPDSLRGIYLDGVVVDEYGIMDGEIFSTVLRPALADRQGWALFLGTPNGKNQFYDLYESARLDETGQWAAVMHKASQTGILPAHELAAAKLDMTTDEYDQEFECSFTASVKGAIYAKELDAARAGGRITAVPVDPVLPVDTYWDLGVGDSTAIWFVQTTRGGEVRVVDYYENSGEGLPHYRQVLTQRGYTYGKHTAPHDIQVRELGSGRSRLETARQMGINFLVAPNVSIDDGIHAVRMLFPRCWFDERKCAVGLENLMAYRKGWNTRLQEFSPSPVHDFASHASDALRYCALSLKPPKDKPSAPYRLPQSPGWMA